MGCELISHRFQLISGLFLCQPLGKFNMGKAQAARLVSCKCLVDIK